MSDVQPLWVDWNNRSRRIKMTSCWLAMHWLHYMNAWSVYTACVQCVCLCACACHKCVCSVRCVFVHTHVCHWAYRERLHVHTSRHSKWLQDSKTVYSSVNARYPLLYLQIASFHLNIWVNQSSVNKVSCSRKQGIIGCSTHTHACIHTLYLPISKSSKCHYLESSMDTYNVKLITTLYINTDQNKKYTDINWKDKFSELSKRSQPWWEPKYGVK